MNYTPLSKYQGTSAVDTIVVGSGMGGMTCAAALARAGKKVLVLEQHYVAGGFTHAFSRKGYSWDVGVHCVGEMAEKQIPGKMLRWISDDRIKMTSLGDVYENFFFPTKEHFPFPSTEAGFKEELKKKFPQSQTQIDQYFSLIKRVVAQSKTFYAGKMFSPAVQKLLEGVQKATSFFSKSRPASYYWTHTIEEVLSEFIEDSRLRTVLTAQWGYYGNIPQEASFAIHALTAYHFLGGGYYPVGGSPKIAEHLSDIIRQAGGDVLVRAAVEEILIRNKKAVGVRMQGGREFFAKNVVSAIGIRNTTEKLLPSDSVPQEWRKEVSELGLSPSYICLNLGFKGDIRAAGATTGNQWFFNTWDPTKAAVWDLREKDSAAPILFLSFPSLKDPLHESGTEMRHTGEVITFVPWDCFEQWIETRRGFRTKEYQEFKKEISERLLAQLQEHIPEVMKLLDYYELSTPLTTVHFTKIPQGGIYGLDVTPKRFQSSVLRVRTPVKRFFLTGSDVTTGGVAGAMSGGLLTASVISKRVFLKFLSITKEG